MSKLILYHGSSEIIENPAFGKGKAYNDYGRGFYCTEQLELAREWACTEGIDGYANCYELETSDLKILNLSSGEYTVLHWLALLVTHRRFRLTTPIMRRSVEWLKEHFYVNIEEYDAIIGYRADDSYFAFARAFLSNEITLKQLNYAMKLGKLGEQFVLKSQKAFDKVHFLSYEMADNRIYYARRKARDEAARNSYMSELENEDIAGIYMRDIIREEMKADDPRLQ
ncbi:MAG: DUF3990 domain-containing protein [Lachnospiraceae bacterium]|nr:DUF3990 domain-containing protein [Lachnospiraceae bacterium]